MIWLLSRWSPPGKCWRTFHDRQALPSRCQRAGGLGMSRSCRPRPNGTVDRGSQENPGSKAFHLSHPGDRFRACFSPTCQWAHHHCRSSRRSARNVGFTRPGPPVSLRRPRWHGMAGLVCRCVPHHRCAPTSACPAAWSDSGDA